MRRSIIAATAVVVGLTLLLAGVAASETNRPLLSGQSGTFTFAPLAVGDQAEYSVEVVDSKGETVEPKRPLWDLQWTNLTSTKDLDGRDRSVAMAFVRHPTSTDDVSGTGITWAVEVGTWNLVHYSYLQDPRVEQHDDRVYESWAEQRYFVDDELFVIPCAMSNRLAGQTVDLSDKIVPMKHCSWHDYWAEDTVLKAVDTSSFDGRTAVTFRNGAGTLQQATFAEGFSFPVQMVVERQDDEGTFHLIRLESYRSGDAPIPATAKPASGTGFQELDLNSWQRYPFGVIDQEYPLDTAVEDARTHEEESRVRDWMANHPDWFVSSARNWNDVNVVFGDRQEYQTWSITLTDGSSQLQFVLDRIETTPAPLAQLPADTLPLEDDPTVQTTTEWKFRALHQFSQPAPLPETIGPLPLARDLIPRWQVLSGMDAANSMEYHIQCISTCEEVYYRAGVGFQSRSSESGESESMDSTYVLTSDGRDGVGMGAQYHASYHRWAYADNPTTQAASNAQAQALPNAWTSPTDEAAIALGSIGLFGGLAGLLWPAIRNIGLIRLFSRIQGNRLLEHPQRQRIMEVVYAEPGIHVRQLRDRLDLGSGVADHHIRKMGTAGLLHVDRRGAYTCLFPQGHMDHSAMGAVPAMKADGARAIVLALRKSDVTQADLQRTTGLSKGTLSYHLKRLVEVGAVEVTPQGRTRSIHLTPLGRKASSAAA